MTKTPNFALTIQRLRREFKCSNKYQLIEVLGITLDTYKKWQQQEVVDMELIQATAMRQLHCHYEEDWLLAEKLTTTDKIDKLEMRLRQLKSLRQYEKVQPIRLR